MATFISVPLKKSSEVDLVKPLTKFIHATYQASDEQGEYIRALEELNKLRKSAVGRPLDKHESCLELLLRYPLLRFEAPLKASALKRHRNLIFLFFLRSSMLSRCRTQMC